MIRFDKTQVEVYLRGVLRAPLCFFVTQYSAVETFRVTKIIKNHDEHKGKSTVLIS